MNDRETTEERNETVNLSMPELIKRIRSNANLTQGQLADRLGTTRARVGRFEQGKTKPAYDEVETLRAIASECKASLDTVTESLDRKTLDDLGQSDDTDDGGSDWVLPVILIGIPVLASLFGTNRN